jgi:uncharacterized protein (DUF2237 family)
MIRKLLCLSLIVLSFPAIAQKTKSSNVLGQDLAPLKGSQITGFYRDGYCRTDENDPGQHAVAATMTKKFLDFTKSRGNDLQTPIPRSNFAGLKPGDKWCLCTARWVEAEAAGVAPPVNLTASHEAALTLVPLKTLQKYQSK